MHTTATPSKLPWRTTVGFGLLAFLFTASPVVADPLFDEIPGLSTSAREALRIHFDARDGVSVDIDGGVTAWEGRDGEGNPVYTAQAQGSGPSTNISRAASGDALVFTEASVSDTRFLYTDLFDTDSKLLSSGEVTVFWLGSYSGGSPQGNGTLGRYAYNIAIRGPGVSGQARGMSHQRRDAGQVVAVFPGSGVTYRGDSTLAYNDSPTVWRTEYSYVGGEPYGTHDFFATHADGTRANLNMEPLTAATIEFATYDPHLYIGSWNDGVVSSSGSGGFSFIGEMRQLLLFEGSLDAADVDAIEAWLVSRAATGDDGVEDLSWSGAVDGQWDRSRLNWTAESGAAAWGSDGSGQRAVFGDTPERSVILAEAVSADGLRFEETGYTVSGSGVLTLTGNATVETEADATIAAPIAGTDGLNKSGSETLTLGGANSYTGNTLVGEGTLAYTGDGAGSGEGSLILAALSSRRAGLIVDTSGTLRFGGASLIGAGENAAGYIRLVNGTLITNGPTSRSFLEIGGGIPGNGSYGAFLVEGGRYESDLGDTTSGIRVGNDGLGYLLQTGGEVFSAGFLGIGGLGGDTGEGVYDLLGGEVEVDPDLRIQIGFRAGAIGTLNVGTLAGGTGTVRHLNEGGLAVAGNSDTLRAVLNLNSGRLILGGPLYRSGNTADSVVNFNGGVLEVGVDGMQLVDDSLPAVNLYAGGLTVDTAGLTASLAEDLIIPGGQGLYPENGEIALVDGGSGYPAAPLVTVSTDGNGVGAMATARIANGEIAAVVITAPGREYGVGDTVTFSFRGGGALVPAEDVTHALTAEDLADNSGGGLTVTGGGRLVLSGDSEHTGPTRVISGTLQSDGLLGSTPLTVEAEGSLTGNFDTLGDVVIEGTLAPGNGVGFGRGFGSVTFGPGSRFAFEIGDWNGISGVGYDTTEFDEAVLSSTAADPMTVVVEAPALQNFSERNQDFVLVDSFEVTGHSPDNWSVDAAGFPGNGTWDLLPEDGRLILRYTAGATSPYTEWAASFPGFTDTDPDADPDGDGIPNLVEFALGRNPTLAEDEALADLSVADGAFVFSFVRSREPVSQTIQTFEYGSDLTDWTSLTVPETTDGAFEIETDVPEAGKETVTVSVPFQAPPENRMFGRLKIELLD